MNNDEETLTIETSCVSNDNSNADVSKVLNIFYEFSTIKDFSLYLQNKNIIENLKYIFEIANIEIINIGCSLKFPEFIIKLANYYKENVFKTIEDYENDNNQRMVYYLMNIVRNFSGISIRFRNEIHKLNGIETLFKYLQDRSLLKAIQNTKSTDELQLITRSVQGCLVNLAKSANLYKDMWKQVNSIEVILNLSEKLKNILDCQLACYIVLAFVAEEEEIPKYPNLKNAIQGIKEMILIISESLKNEHTIERDLIEIEENLSKKVCTVEKCGTQWDIVELFDALYNMVINDSIKEETYFDMKESLQIIIFKGNQVEASYAIKLLWQLCFNVKIANDVLNNKDLIDQLTKFSIEPTEFENLTKNSKGCLWQLNNNSHKNNNEQKNLKSNHIMISYNKESKDLCIRIKDELTQDGHKVWIDFEQIHGSSLESMAKAVEESKCILMCMTEKYKLSPNCRLEAEYSLQLNKPIIPLIMQEKYKPDGWLGMILGSKIFVDFTKYDMEESLRRLRHEIEKLFSKQDEKNDKKDETIIATIQMKPQVQNLIKKKELKREWSSDKIEEWFNEKQFNEEFYRIILPSNGRLLKQLYEILIDAPEFFYSSINSSRNVPLRDVLYFTSELKSLFQDE